MQTAFIGAGAVIGSIFPYLLDHFGVANSAPDGMIPATVRYSFWAGGIALFAAVMWTVLSTREYGPDEMAAFGGAEQDVDGDTTLRALAARTFGSSMT
jgi:maltose/moltooligosaccharide transporter